MSELLDASWHATRRFATYQTSFCKTSIDVKGSSVVSTHWKLCLYAITIFISRWNFLIIQSSIILAYHWKLVPCIACAINLQFMPLLKQYQGFPYLSAALDWSHLQLCFALHLKLVRHFDLRNSLLRIRQTFFHLSELSLTRLWAHCILVLMANHL